MKQIGWILVLWVINPLIAEEPVMRGIDLDASVGLGWIQYEERVSVLPIISDWEAPAGTVHIQGMLTNWAVHLYGDIRFTSSGENVERWSEGGTLIQENDLSYAGTDLRFGLRFPLRHTETLRISPRLGGTFSWESYERQNFFFLRNGGTLFTVNEKIVETVRTAGPTAGLGVWVKVNDRLSLDFDTELAWLGFAEAENDGFGVTIEDGEGWKWQTQLSLLVDLVKENQVLGLSLKADVQEIDGASVATSRGSVEWPDNTLERVFIELVWKATF